MKALSDQKRQISEGGKGPPSDNLKLSCTEQEKEKRLLKIFALIRQTEA